MRTGAALTGSVRAGAVRAPKTSLQPAPVLPKPPSDTISRRPAEAAVRRRQPRCMASQIAVVSRAPSVTAEAQWRTQAATPSAVPLR
ncbi:hypothetical protein GCM10010517_43850 [Streptosporangium fragile]|uniref:Uncharacterized protein n=1 Tax=Streptosporangium fragile TaxID=46186 RepID=A0ABP6IJ88_9ACTN